MDLQFPCKNIVNITCLVKYKEIEEYLYIKSFHQKVSLAYRITTDNNIVRKF